MKNLVLFFWALGCAHGQLNATIPNERRSVLALRQVETPCRYTLAGATYVGQRSAAGGKIEAHTLAGEKTLAVRGTIRYVFGNGTFFEAPWHFEVIGNRGLERLTIIPEPVLLPAGAPRVERAEMRATGALLESGKLCGADGEGARWRWQQGIDNVMADFAEAMHLAESLPEKDFAKAVGAGVIRLGPYARPTSATTNRLLKQNLLATPTLLVKGYKERLKAMQEALRPQSK
ncbi:MAG: hypothetical protein NW208_01360 [Bryobacter sp.]|nr:hypothetical protein [Bryobacter sp.]